MKANRDDLTLSRFFPETSNTPHKTVSAHWSTGERKWSPFGLTPECVQSCPGKKISFLFINSYCVEKIFPVAQMVKELACKAGDLRSIPGSGRSPGGGNDSPLQCSCLENPRMEQSGLQSTGSQRVGHDCSD